MSDKWFDSDYYAQQKLAQMNTTNYAGRTEKPAAGWNLDAYQAELDAWGVTALQNFNACNEVGYTSAITREMINVSPNQYFDVPVYLQNVATYANTAGENGGVWTDPDAPDFPAGGTWTAENVLDYMVAKGISAWTHYTTEGMANGINPSNLFDTNAYLDARAQAMQAASGDTAITRADALKAIQDLGINAIQDWYDYGQDNSITAPEPEGAVTPDVPAGWTQWGEGPVTPEEPDPYEVNPVSQEMSLDELKYQGNDDENTIFEAKYPSGGTGATLSQNDVIDGGTGHNTLRVDLGTSWNGFKQQQDADGNDVASVTNVGRLVLNHTAPFEQSLNFNAKNMEGLERVDIANTSTTGNGTISVSELAATVNTVNLKGQLTNGTTTLKWQNGALDSADGETLTLGLEGVGKAPVAATAAAAGSAAKAAAVQASGFEGLVVDAATSTSNYANIAGIGGIKTLTVEGAGNVDLTGVASTVKTYDASQATGTVKAALSSVTDQTVIKGGEGQDTITLASNTNISRAAWTGIENLVVADSADNVSIKAANFDGSLQSLQVFNSGTTNNTTRLTGVTATDFTIYDNAATSTGTTNITVNGDGKLENLVYNTSANTRSTVTSDATGDVTININNDIRADVKAESTINVNDATGAVTLNVAAKANDHTTTWGGVINAKNAQTFTAEIQGELEQTTGNAAFNVVQGEAEVGRSFTLNAQNLSETPTNATLINASGAWDVDFNLAGSLSLDGTSDLSGARNVEIQLTNTSTTTVDSFDASATDLQAVNSLQVDAGGQDVKFRDLGSADAKVRSGNIDVDIDGANEVIIGTIGTTTGCTIDVNITGAQHNVTLGNITAKTAEDGNAEGDVILKVETMGNVSNTNVLAIAGDDLNIDFSGVDGTVLASKYSALTAAGIINYTGNDHGEGVQIAHLGESGSIIATGGGADSITFGNGTNACTDRNGGTIDNPSVTSVTVDLDDDGTDANDTITISASAASMADRLLINVTKFDGDSFVGIDTTTDWSRGNVGCAVAMLKDFGFSGVTASDISFREDGVDAALGSWFYQGQTFTVNTRTAWTGTEMANDTVLVCIDDIVTLS